MLPGAEAWCIGVWQGQCPLLRQQRGPGGGCRGGLEEKALVSSLDSRGGQEAEAGDESARSRLLVKVSRGQSGRVQRHQCER